MPLLRVSRLRPCEDHSVVSVETRTQWWMLWLTVGPFCSELYQASRVQVGPRLSFQSAWSTNAVSICASCGLAAVTRLELSRRFRLRAGRPLSEAEAAACAALVRVHPSACTWHPGCVACLGCTSKCMPSSTTTLSNISCATVYVIL